MRDPADLGVLELAARLRARQLSAVEVADAYLKRIEERNGGPPTFDGAPEAVNAFARLYPEVTRAQALEADARIARDGDEAPLLCGIPIAVKDLYAVAGLPLTASSRVLEGNVADTDAIVWARLRERGMVLLGHTHTHEFAAGGTTDQVGNPWAIGRIAGGSSGGSGAALAAGMAPAALGSDTCGSLRIPSACCGTSTIKPTHGRIPSDGIIPLAPTLDHPGPMARSIADCAALLSGIDGAPLPQTATPGHKPLAGTTIALTPRPEEADLDDAVARALNLAIRACEALGASLVQLPTPWTFEWDDLSEILMSEAWAYHQSFTDRAGRYRPAIAEFVEIARNFTDPERYIEAQTRRMHGTWMWEDRFRIHKVDLVLEPTLPIVPYERGPGYDRGHAGGPGDPLIALTALWDMTGMPVASLPVSWQAGVSLIAPLGHEAQLVQVALDLQEHAIGVPGIAPADDSRTSDATGDAEL